MNEKTFYNLVFGDDFTLVEQDDFLMTPFMLQEQYGIEIYVEKWEKEFQRSIKETRNVDFRRYWMLSRQEGNIHMEFIVSRIPRQRVSNFITVWYENWTKQGDIQEHHQVWDTLSSCQDSGITMFECGRVVYLKRRSWE